MTIAELLLLIIIGLSVFFPIYTYVIYPLFLCLLKPKKYKESDIVPFISILICFGKGNDDSKINNVNSIKYPRFEIIASKSINKAIEKAIGEILVFVDNETILDDESLINIVKPFFDERVDMVIGEQTCKEGNSAFWKYETKVKKLESRIGSVSGANNTFFAIRKSKIPHIPTNIRNIPFYISMKCKQNRGDIVYSSKAKTYEQKSDGTNFKHHVLEASSYWQAFVCFWRMLFFKRGSFIYISHRVMKWFVWLNILSIVVSLFALSFYHFVVFYVLISLIVFVLISLVISKFYTKGVFGKIFNLIRYFVALNLSYFLGLFYKIQ